MRRELLARVEVSPSNLKRRADSSSPRLVFVGVSQIVAPSKILNFSYVRHHSI